MKRATLGELHEICGGVLRLGDLPPLAGEHSALGRIVHVLAHVREGDLFWPLDVIGGAENRMAEESFHHGAVGVVVTGRRVVPMAGCWSLQLSDAWSGWITWQTWVTRNQKHETTSAMPNFIVAALQRNPMNCGTEKPAGEKVKLRCHTGLPSGPHVSKFAEPDALSLESDSACESVIRIASRVETSRENGE
jgi:hypothetical protein